MAPALTLREPLAADFAWVVERHRELYRREYGWDETFAALGERIVADFSLVRDPNREACKAGYRSLELWTNNVLEDARRLYERNGFRLVDQRAFRGFGHELVEQTWSLCLR